MKEMGIKIGLAVVLTLSLILGMGMPAAQASVDTRVQANLDTTYWHVVDADSIDNVSFPGTNKSTATLLVNSPDSGASVTTPKVTYSPASGLSVGFLFPQYLVPGGPPYVWQFPDIAENGLFISLAGGITGAPFNYEPGFAASRSFSQTEFTGPGTQVIEIYATPEEPI